MAEFKARGTLSIEKLEHREMLASNWGLDAIDAPEVWNRGYTGQGVVVAVIDSGINLHPDLTPNLWVNPGEKLNALDDDNNGYVNDLNGWDFTDNDNSPLTTNRHGNHVSGIIAAAKNNIGTTGVAHDAKIMPLRVFDDVGNSSWPNIAKAIRFAVDHDADVINLSVDGLVSNGVESAIRYASDHDVLIVASSGNHGQTEPSFPASASAKFTNVLSVGAHDKNFRRWNGTNAAGKDGVVQVDAPGVDIQSASTGGSYGSSSGTSSAAAHVAGVAALVLSAKPNLSAEQLREIIVRGATRKVAGSDAVGAVNANRAVNLIGGTATPIQPQPPVTPQPQPADFDRNGVVDFSDFLRLSTNYGLRGMSHAHGDTDRNGVINFADFLVFSRGFSASPPPPSATAVDAALDSLHSDPSDVAPIGAVRFA